MEYNLSTRYHPLARSTIQNVLKVSEEVECLGRILRVNAQFTHRSVNTIPPFMLRTLYMLALPATSLLNPHPEVVTLMTYIEVVHRLSAYIGPRAVYGLVRDFNSTIPRKFDAKIVTKVPGTGPRVAKRCEAEDGLGPVRTGWVREVEYTPYMLPRSPHAGARLAPFPPHGARPYPPCRVYCWDAHEQRQPLAPPMPQPPWQPSQPMVHDAPVLRQPHPVRRWEEVSPLIITRTMSPTPSPVDSSDLSEQSEASSLYSHSDAEISVTSDLSGQSSTSRPCTPTTPPTVSEVNTLKITVTEVGSEPDN
ncbi:hypothetical protein RHS03_09673, partial [Rhizoctonia solani]